MEAKRPKKKEAGSKQKKKNQLLSYLRSFPATSIDDQAALLKVEPRAVRRYHKELIEDGLAVEAGILPVREVLEGYQRYFVFIETTFQLGLAQARAMPKGLKDESRYQEWIAETIEQRVRDFFSAHAVSGGVYILLGGEWDLILIVDVEYGHPEVMPELITRYVRTCPQVLRTSTTWTRSTVKFPKKSKAAHQTTPGGEQITETSPESESTTNGQ